MGIPAFYSPAGVNTYVETGGFPVKFKKGSKEVEEYSKPKEVAIILIFYIKVILLFRKESSMVANFFWRRRLKETSH